jgi:membrane protein implicated in regulation of membrane protease activity
VVVIWVLLAIGFLYFELHHLAFYALFLAIGCATAAVVAVAVPEAYLAQGATMAVVSVAGVGLLRPSLRAAYERRHPHSPAARGVHGGIVGQEAITLDVVGDEHAPGHVRLIGERWLAVSDTGSVATIPAGTRVFITAVRGTTLVVLPVSALQPPRPPLPPASGRPDA